MSGKRDRNRASPAAARTAPDGSRGAGSGSSSGGLLGRVLGPPVPPSMSEMPTFRESLARGSLATASNPVFPVAATLLVFATWVALLGAGFVGAGAAASQTLALPPVSTLFDIRVAVVILGEQSGLIVALGLLLVRAVVVGILDGLIVEAFERGGSVDSSGVARGVLAFPFVLAYLMASFAALFFGQITLYFFGPVVGLIIAQVILPALVLYVFGFVPFLAVRRRLPLAETLRMSLAAARTPGGRHLMFCLLYVLLVNVLTLVLPYGSTITANLHAWTWIGLFLINYAHVAFAGAMAYRWLAVEAHLPPPTRRR